MEEAQTEHTITYSQLSEEVTGIVRQIHLLMEFKKKISEDREFDLIKNTQRFYTNIKIYVSTLNEESKSLIRTLDLIDIRSIEA